MMKSRTLRYFSGIPGRKGANQTSEALVQNIDWGPTLLEYFDVPATADMQGIPLTSAVNASESLREGMLFGVHGGHVNVTDGRYVYMRAPADAGKSTAQ